jgi:hypothetical protein
MLQANGLWKDSHAQEADHFIALPVKDANDLRSMLSYLVGTHGGGTVERIFAPVLNRKDWTSLDRWNGASELMAALKISKPALAIRSLSRSSQAGIGVKGFRRLWQAEQYGGERRSWTPRHYDDVSIGLDFGVLKLATNEDKIPRPIPLDNLLNNLPSSSSGVLPDENLSVDFQHWARSFRMIFRSIYFQNKPEGPQLTGYQVYLLER